MKNEGHRPLEHYSAMKRNEMPIPAASGWTLGTTVLETADENVLSFSYADRRTTL